MLLEELKNAQDVIFYYGIRVIILLAIVVLIYIIYISVSFFFFTKSTEENQGSQLDDSKKEELKDYQELIDRKAAENSTDILPNSSINHAKIIIKYIFRTAREYVCIFDKNLDLISDPKTVEEIKIFLSNGETKIFEVKSFFDFFKKPKKVNSRKFHIVLIGKFSENTNSLDFLWWLKKYQKQFPSSIKIEIASRESIEEIKKQEPDNEVHYFCFSDDRMYRREVDSELHVAQGSFNNPKFVRELREKFRLLKPAIVVN